MYLSQKVLGSDKPANNVWGSIHHKIVEKLDTLLKQACLILIPRGHFKSTLVTQNWTIQQLIKDPTLRILIASAELKNAKAFLGGIKSHFENNPKFIDRFGDWTTKTKWSEEQLDIKGKLPGPKEHTITTASIGTDMTSQHYDVIILDDIVNGKNCSSDEQRHKTFQFYTNCLDLLDPGGKLIVIGTRWHFFDIYSELMKLNKKIHMLDFIVNEPSMYHPRYERREFEKMFGDPETTYCFPERFTPKYVKEIFNKKMVKPGGFYEFACQQMNWPVMDKNSPFRMQDIQFIKTLPIGTVKYITVDPAGRNRITKEQDDTAIVVTGIDMHGNIYCVDCFSEKTTTDGLFTALYDMYLSHIETRKIGLEINYNETNEKWIKEKYPELRHKIKGYKASNQNTKEDRMRALQPYCHHGKFFILEHDDGEEHDFGYGEVKITPGQKKLLGQMIDFGVGHDDALDAQAAALMFLKRPVKIQEVSNDEYIPNDPYTGY